MALEYAYKRADTYVCCTPLFAIAHTHHQPFNHLHTYLRLQPPPPSLWSPGGPTHSRATRPGTRRWGDYCSDLGGQLCVLVHCISIHTRRDTVLINHQPTHTNHRPYTQHHTHAGPLLRPQYADRHRRRRRLPFQHRPPLRGPLRPPPLLRRPGRHGVAPRCVHWHGQIFKREASVRLHHIHTSTQTPPHTDAAAVERAYFQSLCFAGWLVGHVLLALHMRTADQPVLLRVGWCDASPSVYQPVYRSTRHTPQ